MKRATQRLGHAGEEAVAQQLKKNGYTLLARNLRRPYGEIDIIAQRDDRVCFVEVKTRRSTAMPPTCLVPPSKQRKISLVARAFIAEHSLHTVTCQFDVALVTPINDTLEIEYIPNAFTCDE